MQMVRATPGSCKTTFTPAEAVARLQETQRKRIDPVHVTVVGEAYRRYDTKLWMRDLMEGAAYLPK